MDVKKSEGARQFGRLGFSKVFRNFFWEFDTLSFDTLMSFCYFEPEIWRRLMPLPACYDNSEKRQKRERNLYLKH